MGKTKAHIEPSIQTAIASFSRTISELSEKLTLDKASMKVLIQKIANLV